ncbi:MAG TPA: L-2-amino-thiazoline-4-carboxylic acid hydrolase [Bryobacteraceae bacterium]|nr:L-2-amino-thiazoline-4-carboxylic acid hydrolase [Bryobacteraceae bacterium]
MNALESKPGNGPLTVSRRGLFAILHAGAAGCLGCARAAACASQPQPPQAGHSWTEKADMTWEELFRFAYQKDLIPVLKALAGQVGRDQFVRMLQDAGDSVVRTKMAGRPPVVRDLVTFASNMKNMPPVIQHALDAEILEASPEAFEYRVNRCLWAKVFRDGDAGDIGYAMVCYPDYAVARGLNPKLKLIRTRTLMQGADSCSLRYVMEA